MTSERKMIFVSTAFCIDIILKLIIGDPLSNPLMLYWSDRYFISVVGTFY